MAESTESNSGKKRARIDSDAPSESPEAKRLREDILDILDDVDFPGDPAHDFASVMKILEEEISPAEPALPPPLAAAETQPDLGFLLGASDDELGLPPSESPSGAGECGLAVAEGLGQLWGFEDEMPSYDVFELGFPEESNAVPEGMAVFGGLFDCDGFGSDFSDVSAWQPESLASL